MEDIKNWKEVSNGYFRYVIAAKAAYEILVEFWFHDTPIETAKGSLCIIGDWNNASGATSREREWIMRGQPIQDLLIAAVKDNEENNKY